MHRIVLKLMVGCEQPVKISVPFLFLFLSFILLNIIPATAQQVAKTSPAGTKMWVYTPPGYSTSTATYPMLVFLHGGGEIGDDLTKLTTGTSHLYPPKLISTGQWDSKRPFIVVSPQLKRDLSVSNPNDQTWPTSYVNEVIEYVRKNYRIDSYRIYITGISLGGAGCWDYAAAYPAKVAAVLAISGKSDVSKACLIKGIPVWAFHGENDALVPNKFSIDMVNAIKACNGAYKPRLNLLWSRSHEGWSELYNLTNGYDIYNWFLKFRKNNTANKTPYVNAGIDNKIVLRSTTHHIYGDYFDWNGSISVVKWTQTAGPALTLAGTNTAFLRLSGLKVGIYEFQLAVTDNSGAVSSDRVKLEVVSSNTPPAITGITLLNGKTNATIANLTEGYVINKTTLGTTEFNLKATVSTGVYSVRYRVNADQHTKTANSPGPYVIKKQSTTPEWVMTNGSYVICATPYPQTGGRGTPGVSLCYKVTVTQSSTATVTASSVQPEDAVTITSIDDILISNANEGNQWVFNGEDIEGATGPVYKPSVPGEYYVRLTNRNAYDVSNSVRVAPQEATDRRPALEVYPNPAREYLQVQGEHAIPGTTYRILRSGMTISEGQVPSDKRIQLSPDMTRGDYILMLRTQKGNQSVKFIIE